VNEYVPFDRPLPPVWFTTCQVPDSFVFTVIFILSPSGSLIVMLNEVGGTATSVAFNDFSVESSHISWLDCVGAVFVLSSAVNAVEA